jgi:hypothetical protein
VTQTSADIYRKSSLYTGERGSVYTPSKYTMNVQEGVSGAGPTGALDTRVEVGRYVEAAKCQVVGKKRVKWVRWPIQARQDIVENTFTMNRFDNLQNSLQTGRRFVARVTSTDTKSTIVISEHFGDTRKERLPEGVTDQFFSRGTASWRIHGDACA